jgi:hypothetical protein
VKLYKEMFTKELLIIFIGFHERKLNSTNKLEVKAAKYHIKAAKKALESK